MTRLQVYLAGPITGLTFGDANDWRAYAVDVLESHGIEGLSPMRGKDFIMKRLGEREVLGQTYEDSPLSAQRGIVARDRFDVGRTDIVLFNLLGAERVSIGTMIEYGWASAQGKVIVTVMEKTANIHDHAFVRELSPFRVETLDEALDIIAAIGRTWNP
jgi:nucleoside 2-deoxyribosyltransferase